MRTIDTTGAREEAKEWLLLRYQYLRQCGHSHEEAQEETYKMADHTFGDWWADSQEEETSRGGDDV